MHREAGGGNGGGSPWCRGLGETENMLTASFAALVTVC